jgi:SM-20-related protein
MQQISNHVFCEDFLTQLNIESKILPNPYYDYPFLVIKNFFSPKSCRLIVDSIRKNSDAIDAKIRVKKDIIVEEKLSQSIRKTKVYELEEKFATLYEKNFKKHQKMIEEFFSLALTTSTQIQTLEYTKGSFYKAHSDDSNVLLKEDKIVGFLNVAPQRKITTVLFATSCDEKEADNHFSGGELVFNYLYDKQGNNITLKPQAGDMIVFLSNPFFTHEVKMVKNGYRLTMVQWHDAVVQ